ncbi:hypothetical protein [Dielma fastidiosa]|uniref:hypothetical protein n=1 Tax=Dielma fastidiosa TaxID=1034346 RepID=UPI000E4D505E|nr:hypothetical protein [Dielma fastidiosa]RHN01750.1 hypothetical protein DWZ33_07085 [Dielma fastidiosa]
MNKYSSKAVKTAATVGMSLAMVLSNAAPVFAATNVSGVCNSTYTSELNDFLNFLSDSGLTEEGFKTKNSEDSVKITTGAESAQYYALDEGFEYKGADLTVPATGLKVTDTAGDNINNVKKLPLTVTVNKTEAGAALFVKESDSAGTYTQVTTAEELEKIAADNVVMYQIVKKNIEKSPATSGTTDKVALFDKISTEFATGGAWEHVIDNCTGSARDLAKLMNDTVKDIKAMLGADYSATYGTLATIIAKTNPTSDDLDKLTDFNADYADNLTSEQANLLNDTIYGLERELGYESSTDAYQTALSRYIDKETKALEDFVTDTIYTAKNGSAITKTLVKEKIANIKDTSDYKRFKNEADVEAIIAQYEEMTDAINDVAAAINTRTNDAYADLLKGTKSVKSKYANKDTDAIVDSMKTADFEILKAFKEDVVDIVWTMEAKSFANRYLDKSTKSPYVTATQLNKVLNDFNADLIELKDSETGEFGWDILDAHMTKVNDSLAALADLSKYDAITLSVNDKEVLVKMDDAVYFLENDGAGNLSTTQTRTVRDAARKVTELMEAYRKQFGSIDSTVNGWNNKGNGDWTYYENGNAVTKWVASGSDWYYVKGGVMLRNSWIASDSQGTKWYYVDDAGKMVSNTTVNGYTFNSYGVWVK